MGDPVEVLCLANSVKNEERCLAGVRLDTGGWIRPVSDVHGSALVTTQYTTASGEIPKPLDTVRLEVSRQYPKYNQPENWVISGKDWQLVTTELSHRQMVALNAALQWEGKIIFNDEKSIPKHKISDEPVLNSLTVVIPESPEFFTRSRNDVERPYTVFRFDGIEYELAITDPAWRDRAETSGELPSADVIDDDEEILFTISLGEEWEGRCYKLVAAIFTVPSEKLAERQ